MPATLSPPARTEPLFRPLPQLDRARDPLHPQDRLRRVEAGARALREALLAGPQVLFYRSFDLVRVPYPVQYGLFRAARVTTPLVHIVNRVFVVQLRGLSGRVETLLISPSDVQANRRTPFFARLAASARWIPAGERLLAPVLGSVEQALQACGLEPADVDWIAYDHLHTQDVRRWLGTPSQPGFFPRARLLVTRQEWATAQGPHLPGWDQWYVSDGVEGVDPARVVLLPDQDLLLGEGLALVRTPGHTEGNMSFAVHTPEGVLVTSENGISADNYAPLRSRIPGVARFARETGAAVVMNGNTLERGIDQYLSMVLERELGGPCRRAPEFWNVVPSSELTAYWAFPGVRPTFRWGELSFGTPRRTAPAP